MRIITRIIEAIIGMVAILIFIHLLCLCLWLVMSFILWENPIDVLIRGFTKLWKPITHDGWSIANRIALVLWFIMGLILTVDINGKKGHDHLTKDNKNKYDYE